MHITLLDMEELLQSYQNPHRDLEASRIRKLEKERQDLIKSIDKSRHDSQVMAKLQLDIENKLAQTRIVNSNKAAKLL